MSASSRLKEMTLRCRDAEQGGRAGAGRQYRAQGCYPLTHLSLPILPIAAVFAA
jgi:hypothetical protein